MRPDETLREESPATVASAVVLTPDGDGVDLPGWRRTMDRAVAPAAVAAGPGGFCATIRAFAHNDVRVARTAATPHTAHRSPCHIAAPGRSEIVLAFQTSGRSTVVQGGRAAALSPGDAVVFDTSRPYTVVFEEPFVGVTAVVPREQLFGAAASPLTGAAMVRASDPVAATVRGTVSCLERRLTDLPPLPRHRAVQTIVEMVGMLCLHLAGPHENAEDARAVALGRVLEYIDAHLRDPGLGPRAVADAHFMSLRAVHALARSGGISIAGWIRRQRLDRCRDDLANPALHTTSVAEIGASWGLDSAAYFCTLFHRTFGVTPGAYRDRVLQRRG